MSKERENKNFKQTLKEYLMYTCLTLIIRLYDVTSCSLEISNDPIKPLECFNSFQFHLLLQDERTHNSSKSFSWLVYLEIRFYFQRARTSFMLSKSCQVSLEMIVFAFSMQKFILSSIIFCLPEGKAARTCYCRDSDFLKNV